MSNRILLSVPDPILKKLEAEMEKYAYSSLQEVIVDALRDKFYFQAGKKEKTKRGRPKKIREEKILTRKKIFSKKGEPIRV
tara:strand:+ start:511 stop:753 length:243 start_codon:yes stop_codon:yes gene_type:complete